MSIYTDHLFMPLNEADEVLNEKTAEEWRALGLKLRGRERQMEQKANNFLNRSKELEQFSFYTPNHAKRKLASDRASRLHSVANHVFSHAYGEKWRPRDLLRK